MDKKQLKHNRARFEDQLLSRFKDVLPEGVEVILLADRGFADQKFFRFLEEALKFKYIIRIKSNTTIIHKEIKNKASQWLKKDGKIVQLKQAYLTLEQHPIQQFIAVINHYSRRWKIVPYFRDLKDSRYGLGLEQTHIKSTERGDRLMLILAFSYNLLSILGEAGEMIDFDKKLKVNTVNTRTHSQFRQGQFYYKFFVHFTEEEKNILMMKFDELLNSHDFWEILFFEDKK